MNSCNQFTIQTLYLLPRTKLLSTLRSLLPLELILAIRLLQFPILRSPLLRLLALALSLVIGEKLQSLPTMLLIK